MRLLRAGQRGAPPLNCGVMRHIGRYAFFCDAEVAVVIRFVTVVLSLLCCVSASVAQDQLFSFGSVLNNAAQTTRSFSANEVLTVIVEEMARGDRLILQRCGNDRCSVGAPVAEWAFLEFGEYTPVEVQTTGDRYTLMLFNGSRGVIGSDASVQGVATVVRFESGTLARVTVRSR
jgi:hypothetical protein